MRSRQLSVSATGWSASASGFDNGGGVNIKQAKPDTGSGYKVNLDIFWLKEESLEESANLPASDVVAAGIMEDLEVALEQFREIASDLGTDAATKEP